MTEWIGLLLIVAILSAWWARVTLRRWREEERNGGNGASRALAYGHPRRGKNDKAPRLFGLLGRPAIDGSLHRRAIHRHRRRFLSDGGLPVSRDDINDDQGAADRNEQVQASGLQVLPLENQSGHLPKDF